jgi:hypothetical protein
MGHYRLYLLETETILLGPVSNGTCYGISRHALGEPVHLVVFCDYRDSTPSCKVFGKDSFLIRKLWCSREKQKLIGVLDSPGERSTSYS